MPTCRSLYKPLLWTLILLGGNAWSAAVENDAPRSRLATKLKPAKVVAPAPEEELVLDEAQLLVATHVHHGEVQCEFNQKVHLTPHPEKPGRFSLQFGKMNYTMVPEPTTTGAVRLEDKKAGVVWLQIPTKSMLMNSRLGQRMADACMHPTQVALVNAAAKSPSSEGGIGITPGR